MAHYQRPHEPSTRTRAFLARLSAAMFSLFVIFAIVAAVFAGFYLLSSSAPSRVANTSVSPAFTQPVDPTAPPTPKALQEETRPTQTPIP
jgi:hypothetical protein